ncbi:MAG: hypothetical protein M3Y82_05295 [Verrucomicrobiota bacterium]|nr:hypothetical protein [Verrucomicrobiota bacterium]
MKVKIKSPARAVRPAKPLVKGQLWKMKETHIEIMEVGKTLTRYRFFKNQVRVPTSLGGIVKVQDYLKTNKAKLIPNPRFAVK